MALKSRRAPIAAPCPNARPRFEKNRCAKNSNQPLEYAASKTKKKARKPRRRPPKNFGAMRCRRETAFKTAEALTGIVPDAGLAEHEICRRHALFAPEHHAAAPRKKHRAALAVMRAAPDLPLRLARGHHSPGIGGRVSRRARAARQNACRRKRRQTLRQSAGFEPEASGALRAPNAEQLRRSSFQSSSSCAPNPFSFTSGRPTISRSIQNAGLAGPDVQHRLLDIDLQHHALGRLNGLTLLRNPKMRGGG